jgi:hypothetical protein
MAHDATKILGGTVKMTGAVVDNFLGTIAAGTIVRMKSDGTIVVTKADGEALGVSLGKSMSDTSRTAVCRSGLMVPVLLTAGFTPTVGAQVCFSDTTGLAIASGAGATAVNAEYATSTLTFIKEDGTTGNGAYINMKGGL